MRAIRATRLFMSSRDAAERWAKRHADNMTACSCWLCRPNKVFRHLDLREQKQRIRERDFEGELEG